MAGGRRVALELILYEDPPRPLLRYQGALDAAWVIDNTGLAIEELYDHHFRSSVE